MLHEYVHPITTYLHAHPHWGGLVAFIITFLESLAVIGTIIPGTVTMTAIGALIGSDVLPAGPTILWAIAGAYVGDCLSYWAGIYFGDNLRRIWPFKKYPQLITKGEKFFKLHGGKSILIGRFTGPVRSLVPMIAGLLKMRPMRFLPIAFFAAVLWAIIYITPGIILGALSLELPPKTATKFIFLSLLVIAALWLLTWFIKYFIDQLWNQVDRALIKLWNYLNVHKSSHWITQFLRNPTHEEDHQQLTRAVFAGISLLLFFVTLYCISSQIFIYNLNLPLYSLLQSFRIRYIDVFMIGTTLLGDKHVLLIMAAIVTIWLAWHKRWWTAAHWLGLTIISAGSIEFFKRMIHSPRPPVIALVDHTSSFPSGHTILSLTLFGFLAVMIADNTKNMKKWIYLPAIILTALIAFSRLYLGAHWFTDIVASIFFGLFLILMTVLSYRRRNLLPIPANSLILVAGLTLFISWIGYSYFNFKTIQQDSLQKWPPIVFVNEQAWLNQTAGKTPLYRINRFGKPSQPLNIQWLDSLQNISNALTVQGWQNQSTRLNLNTTLNRLIPPTKQQHLPILPMLYHNRPPVLLMTKYQSDHQPVLVLRLWNSDILVNHAPLYIGSVNFYSPPRRILSLPKKNSEQFYSIADVFKSDLKEFNSKQITITLPTPNDIDYLHWDKKVILITPK